MAERNYGTMYMGYRYDESKTNIGYDIWVKEGIGIHNVAYHSKSQLIKQLIESGYDKVSIQSRRVVYK
jgi:hypothetical protein